MNIAIVHDWLTEFAGAEKVVLEMLKVYPNAKIYTSIFDKEKVKEFSSFDVRTTYLQNIPFSKKFRRLMIPLMPMAFEQLDLSGFDVVISSTTSAAKGVITKPRTCHICYCNTPTRYLWEPSLDSRASNSWLKRKINHNLRIWDSVAAERVDYFIANSKYIAKRIRKYYHRDSKVIYPPVDLDFYKQKNEVKKGEYFLFVSRLVPYKRADLAIMAFNDLGLELRIIGGGSEEKKLKKIAKKNIKFLGRASDVVLRKNIKEAKAVIFPAEEDFGIVPVEAMASGTPVIAYGAGGAQETVIEGVTGEFFRPQMKEALIEVVKNFDPKKYKVSEMRTQAEKFSAENFRRNLKKAVESFCFEYKNTMNL
ncbi:MAG: group 1 glycosyl transferase [Candidatus Berkelbacteria bacterium Athens1014_28]|uniref:Group 1 glycosyl transferase n=1 Tax=Candidatus Berkelbacteria bacterium Athens1014_28 TaxID=2017145 RepID=A0A554LN63_9BACT|nr:MAG: group 1 glycosyl transferase [Candidatus Berkelbacteria bacterium Athens1014_28]